MNPPPRYNPLSAAQLDGKYSSSSMWHGCCCCCFTQTHPKHIDSAADKERRRE